ncbi:MarR family transcriptional regulator [Shewanella canadensis]|uniref:MarR family transcriptional regulator n=2 Tax=Shewanella canadensis TaxID=271096 RepID=A0A431WXR3_9GAMM|nr:MarR family transcriptional regulator [Shewanella canadensis]
MADNWPECAKTAYPALLRLGRVSDIFQQTIHDFVGDYQLQKADFGVLCALRRNPAPHCLSPTELYQSMLFSSGGLTKVLSRLSQAGLIERYDNPEDKRSKLVQLTEKGKLLVEEVLPGLHQQEKRILEVLSADELAQLDTLMQRILDRYELP